MTYYNTVSNLFYIFLITYKNISLNMSKNLSVKFLDLLKVFASVRKGHNIFMNLNVPDYSENL